jgi:hypothetical protein
MGAKTAESGVVGPPVTPEVKYPLFGLPMMDEPVKVRAEGEVANESEDENDL